MKEDFSFWIIVCTWNLISLQCLLASTSSISLHLSQSAFLGTLWRRIMCPSSRCTASLSAGVHGFRLHSLHAVNSKQSITVKHHTPQSMLYIDNMWVSYGPYLMFSNGKLSSGKLLIQMLLKYSCSSAGMVAILFLLNHTWLQASMQWETLSLAG